MPLRSTGVVGVDNQTVHNTSLVESSQTSQVYYLGASRKVIQFSENELQVKRLDCMRFTERTSISPNAKLISNSLIHESDNFQMNASSRQSQKGGQQPHPQFQQQLQIDKSISKANQQNAIMVSEDLLEQNKFSKSSVVQGVNNNAQVNLTSNDLLNHTQIIKLVTDGESGNLLIDPSTCGSNTMNSGLISSHHGNSKVHVISNVTFVSKQIGNNAVGQTQQTINVVNAKGMPYLATKHHMQSSSVMPKIANIPPKNISGKSGNSGNISSPHNQNHYLPGTSMHVATGSAVSQKSAMPRNVQVVARTQNISASTSQLLIQNIQSPPTNAHHSSQQDLNLASNQMVLQQKVVTNANANNNSKGTPKKQTLNHSLKFVQHKCTNPTIGARGPQNYFSQQTAQMQNISPGHQNAVGKLTKSQKLTRQQQQNGNTSVSQCIQQLNCGNIVQAGKVNNYCQQQNLSSKLQNSSNQNSCNKYIMQTQILSTVASQTPVNNCKVVTTHNTSNVINTNASVCSFNVLSNSNTSHSNNISNYNINSTNNAALHGSTNVNKVGTMGNVNANSSGNLVVIQNNAGCGNLSNNGKNTFSGSTIKYVNTHGTVVQSQHMESSNQFSFQQQTQALAPKGRGRLPSQTTKHRNDQNILDGRSSILPSDIVNNGSTYMPVSINGKQSAKNEEIMIVNGTQMTEEMSARILQSLSQKASHNNNNTKQYQGSHATLSHLPDSHYGQKNATITGPSSNGIDSSIVKEEYSIPSISAECEKQDALYMDLSIQSNQIHNHNASHQKLQISQQTVGSQRPLFSKTTERTHNYDRLRSSKGSTEITEIFKVIGDNGPAAQQAEHEDEIGEEIRPQPVSTNDMRIQTLHAVLQDHNYVAQMPTRLPSEIQSTSNLSMCGSTINKDIFVASCNATQDSGGNSSNLMQQQIISPSSGNVIVQSNSISPSIGLPFLTMDDENHNDDDANSVISDETGHAGLDNDLGEETETAPEAEAEDDSVTRCICDLTHDDGYMICCDKCSAWQHVDCMGIDRQNIPDEYLCEICQPREVDRARAKNLQLTKRREQISFPITSTQSNISTLSVSGSFNNNENHTFQNSNLQSDRVQPNPTVTACLGTPPIFRKKNKNSGNTKRKELLKRSKKERNSSKRRDVKRVTRRKKTSYNVSDGHLNERNNTTINQWLENYEVAVTNHYSPELRARLHAICKQQNVMQSVIASENKILKNCSGMQSKCTTVPFSGGKILISNFDIQPNAPIVELRGKYMLTTQYKTQNPSVNTNSNVGIPHNPHAIRNQKIPGPFIFFYKLCNEVSAPEICVDTRTYSNEARFVRRSCRPNAEIQHYFEKGTLHLYLVSTAFINGGTEITIKHEPHDLAAVNHKQISVLVAPTSTICACDAPKECLFSNHVGNIKISRKALLNGYVGEKLKSISTKKEVPSSIARGRSISSSGESNIGLLSPSNQNAGFHNPPSIGNLQNDSGVYTSSSSPSVSLPSPTHAQIISSPTQQCQQKLQSNPKTQAEPLEIPVHSATGTIDNGFSKGLQRLPNLSRKATNKQGRHSISEDPTTSAAQINFQDEKHENRKLSREERKMDAIIRAFEKMEKTQQRKQELKQARSTVAVGKTRTSISPSPKSMKGQLATEVDNTCILVDVTQPRKGATSAKKRKRKGSKSHLTNQQKRRRRINSNDSDILSSGESCLLSPTLTSNGDSKPVVTSNSEDGENRVDLQDLVDNSNLVVNDQNINHAAGLLLALANNDAGNTEQVAIAQVDNSEMNKRAEADISNIDVATIHQDLGNQTPPMVSSTCLLVEAAVAPLENADGFAGEFKLPAKTKTKKSIMNDWLNQSLDFQHPADDPTNLENQTQTQLMQSFDPKGLDTLVQAAATICDYRRSTSSPASFMNTSNDEAQNISIAAKKVEEFIHQTNINLHSNEELSKQADLQTNNIEHQNHKDLPVCAPHSMNNCSGGSSVKKRWLRQAISEECSDELTICLPVTSPTQLGQNAPVGFTTPLKKRRVIRQCTEEEQSILIKDSESQTLVRINPSPDEIKTEIKEEFGEIDEEVDIINSPIPEEKIYKAESFVKIESEDCKIETHIPAPIAIETSYDSMKEEAKNIKGHCSEIKTENELGEKSCDSKNEAHDGTEFQLQTTTPGQGEDYVDVSDEIADIQKRLHSFHTENIMILQSRNKKSKISRSVKGDDSTISANSFLKNGRQDKHEKGILKHEELKSFKKEKHSSSKRKHLDFEEFSKNDIVKFKEDDISKKEQFKTKFTEQLSLESKSENFYAKGHSNNEVSDHVELQLKPEPKVDYSTIRTTDGKMFQAALTIPNFNQTIIPPSTQTLRRSSYSLENSEKEVGSSVLSLSSPVIKSPHDGYQSDEKQTTLTNVTQAVEDAEGSPPPPLHLPYFNTIYGKLVEKDASSIKAVNPAVSSANILLSDYLDTKVRSYSSLGGYVSHSALFGLKSNNANCSMESMNIGSVNCSQNIINKDDDTISSNDNNNNNSRIGGTKNVLPTTTNVKSTLFKTNEPVSQCMASTCSKIVTKTASADPRLNPTLTAPEPVQAPKRKLSINEYRKRKQLSSEAAISSNGAMVSKNFPFKTSSERTSKSRGAGEGREKSFGDISSTYNAETINEAKVQFSPTPTLLEQQQETLCERLKSLKSQSSALHSSSSSSLCSESNMALVPKLMSSATPASFNSMKASEEKEEFLLSHNINISSLDSISSSSSPVSSKESTPERDGCRS